MKVRRIRKSAAVLVAGIAVITALSGCSLVAPQETLNVQETAEGVNGTVGSVFVGNAVLLTPKEGTPTSLVATLVNSSDSNEQVQVITSAGNAIVTVPANGNLKLGSAAGKKVVFEGLGAKQGSLASVAFTSGSDAITLRVPVLGGQLEQYKNLVPSPVATPTPTPAATTAAR